MVRQMKYWRYLLYVIRHKWFVFVACCQMGIPFAGLTHDLSKFLPDELIPYAEYFYGGHPRENKPEWVQEAFDRAWLKHQRRSGHHWQAWILRFDDGGEKLIEMPDRYRDEMLADWMGAGRSQGKPDTAAWYRKNREKIQLHPLTRVYVDGFLGLLSESRFASFR